MKMLRKTLCAMTVGVVTLGPVMSSTVFAAPVADFSISNSLSL